MSRLCRLGGQSCSITSANGPSLRDSMSPPKAPRSARVPRCKGKVVRKLWPLFGCATHMGCDLLQAQTGTMFSTTHEGYSRRRVQVIKLPRQLFDCSWKLRGK